MTDGARRTYVIHAPPYTELSAGAKALWMLRDALRARGEKAEVVEFGAVWAEGLEDGEIAVYPDIIDGNPLGAYRVARWLLYFAGAYRGNRVFPKQDQVWGYTTRIARDYGTGRVMFLPTVDETVFVPPPEGTARKGACFYAHKHRTFYGGSPRDVLGAVEITNPGQSREEIIRLLQTSEVFYAWEDTALIIEAVLCGCPVVCMPSDYFREACGLEDFSAGIAWGMEEFGRAIATVGEARRRYALLKDTFEKQLDRFIEETQA